MGKGSPTTTISEPHGAIDMRQAWDMSVVSTVACKTYEPDAVRQVVEIALPRWAASAGSPARWTGIPGLHARAAGIALLRRDENRLLGVGQVEPLPRREGT